MDFAKVSINSVPDNPATNPEAIHKKIPTVKYSITRQITDSNDVPIQTNGIATFSNISIIFS